MDLATFAKEEDAAPRTRCRVCKLPPALRDQVNDARSDDKVHKVTYRVITKWLQKEGHEVNYGSIVNHFQQNHASRD